jgi:hypothetical protein
VRVLVLALVERRVDVIGAQAEIALVAVLTAVGICEEKIVQEEITGAVSSGPVRKGATAVWAFEGPIDGKHGTNHFLAWDREYTPKRFALRGTQLWLLASRRVLNSGASDLRSLSQPLHINFGRRFRFSFFLN